MKSVFAAALLATTCLLILGWFDHHAAEYDPMHTHLAPGLLGTALDLRTLPHTHAFAIDHPHGDAADPPLLLVAGDAKQGLTAAVSLHATGDKAATAVLPASELMKGHRIRIGVVPFSSLWFSTVDLEVLDPPPRSA